MTAMPTTEASTYPEPEDGATVAWTDAGGDPAAIYHRNDHAAWESGYSDEDRLCRWFKFADEVTGFGPMSWGAACRDARGWPSGPYLLRREPLPMEARRDAS